MKVYELYEGVGRIVKGVNTTPDVGVNQTSIEAAKFGNTVDKDGRPPTLSSKVKGKSTNVLFNLGLTEGVMLKFQRGEDFDTLHIKPKGKNRVELRGKPGYERGNYDAQDKLHQVLDNLGKAANFAELMNGETVSINPNHPDGERANKTAQDILSTEGFGDWLKTALNSDPQFKAWHRMYKQDPQKAKATFGRKHTEFLAQLQSESIEEEVQTTAPDWNPRPWDDLDIKNYKDRIDRDYQAITGRDQDFKNKILAMFPNPQRPDYKTAKQLLAKYEKEHEAVQAYINKRIKEVKATEKPGQQRTWLKSDEYKKLARKKNSINAVMAEILNMLSDTVDEAWSKKYKRSINCNNPKGFSQRAHCQGRKKK